MYQELWTVFIFEFFVLLAAQEQKQRTASLIVLPPLVLGYDELYEDKSPEKIEKLKQPTKAQTKTKLKNPINKPKPLMGKDNKLGPNTKRSNVKFIRQGHKLNFMGHFLLPHDENDCPFHDSPDPKFELMNIAANRRSQGKLNLRRNLEGIVKGNLLKSLASPQSRTVDDKGNLVVSGKVLHIGDPKAANKRNNKPKEILTAKNKEVVKLDKTLKVIKKADDKPKETATVKNEGITKPKEIDSFGATESNITNDLLRELAVRMINKTAKNKGITQPKEIVRFGATKSNITTDLLRELAVRMLNNTAKNKGITKPKETLVSSGATKSNITNDLLKELAVGMLSGILLN